MRATGTVSLGDACLCVVAEGITRCFGRCHAPPGFELGVDVAEISVSASDDLCLRTARGEVICYGQYRGEGELGSIAPVVRRFEIGLAEPARDLSARARDYACAVLQSGRVQCWETTRSSGEISPRPGAPEEIELPEPAMQVEAGDRTSCALGASGVPYCWDHDCLRDDCVHERFALRIEGVPRLHELSVRHDGYVCGVDDRGGVWCWGSELRVHAYVSDPRARRRTDVLGVAGLDLGAASCARLRCGRVQCWPTRVTPKLAEPVAAVAGASMGRGLCALDPAGRVRCFGIESQPSAPHPLAALRGRWTPLAHEAPASDDENEWIEPE